MNKEKQHKLVTFGNGAGWADNEGEESYEDDLRERFNKAKQLKRLRKY